MNTHSHTPKTRSQIIIKKKTGRPSFQLKTHCFSFSVSFTELFLHIFFMLSFRPNLMSNLYKNFSNKIIFNRHEPEIGYTVRFTVVRTFAMLTPHVPKYTRVEISSRDQILKPQRKSFPLAPTAIFATNQHSQCELIEPMTHTARRTMVHINANFYTIL